MKSGQIIKPDFLIVGAQKCGTSWLWDMLKQHPGTDLSREKEPHFFSKSHNYRKGMDYYYNTFSSLNPSRVTGEASTSYLYDRVRLNVHLEFKDVKVDNSLPTIPELITKELPDIKIFILLRDPVRRAISAHNHYIKSNIYSPFFKLQDAIQLYPNRIIVGFGQYLKYIKLWKQYVPPERMRIYIFEEDIRDFPEETMKNTYRFLNLDPSFSPENLRNPIHKGMSISNLLMYYYFNILLTKLRYTHIGTRISNFSRKKQMPRFVDKIAYKITPGISKEEIEYLRSVYLPEKEELEQEIGRSLDCWKYDYNNKC